MPFERAWAVVGASVLVGCGVRASPPALAPPPPAPRAAPAEAVRPTGEEPTPEPSTPSRAHEPTRVILVTLDGVRWQDVFAEDSLTDEPLMPRTRALVDRSGIALGHLAGCGLVRPRGGTNISLPGYLEIFTGRRTACMSNVCANVREATVLDVASSAGVTTASIGSWDMLSAAVSNGAHGVLVSAGTAWPRQRPVTEPKLADAIEEGSKAKPFPAYGGTYRPDRYTTAIALEYLRARRPRLFHVGLGDPDEYAHRDDKAGYAAAVRDADVFLGQLADTLAELELWESTAVLVTADHGRGTVFREHGASYPESGRSFLVAFGGRVPHHGDACAAQSIWLTDFSATIRSLLGLPQDRSADAVGVPIREILAE